jgi:predicted RNA binding protein YcfA (HicA-like mRNA interferase family)
VKVRDVLRALTSDGWEEVRPRTAGDHRQFTHPSKPGRVTIAGAPGDDLAPGTLASIRKQARLPRLGRS